MALRVCDSFHYRGTVPQTKAARESGEWTLHEQSGGGITVSDRPDDEARLVGLCPSLQCANGHLILRAEGPEYAVVSSVRLELDAGVLDAIEWGDEIEIVRTRTGDLAASVLRAGRLVWAIGAVTKVDLGEGFEACNPALNDAFWRMKMRWLSLFGRLRTWEDLPWRKARYVQFSLQDRKFNVLEGETSTLGEYTVTVVRTWEEGIPGDLETVAISRGTDELHEATLRAAVLAGRRSATAVRFSGMGGNARWAMGIRHVES